MYWLGEPTLGMYNWLWLLIVAMLATIAVALIILTVLKIKRLKSESKEETHETIVLRVGKESTEMMEQSPVTVKAETKCEQPAKEAEPAKEQPAEEKAEPVAVSEDEKTEEKSQPEEVQTESAAAEAKSEEEKVKDNQPAKAQPTPAKTQPAPAKAPAAKPATKTYHISLRKSDGMWQVKAANAEKAIKLFNTQAEAIEYCKTLADNQEANIMIHKKDGSFRKLTY